MYFSPVVLAKLAWNDPYASPERPIPFDRLFRLSDARP